MRTLATFRSNSPFHIGGGLWIGVQEGKKQIRDCGQGKCDEWYHLQHFCNIHMANAGFIFYSPNIPDLQKVSKSSREWNKVYLSSANIILDWIFKPRAWKLICKCSSPWHWGDVDPGILYLGDFDTSWIWRTAYHCFIHVTHQALPRKKARLNQRRSRRSQIRLCRAHASAKKQLI